MRSIQRKALAAGGTYVVEVPVRVWVPLSVELSQYHETGALKAIAGAAHSAADCGSQK